MTKSKPEGGQTNAVRVGGELMAVHGGRLQLPATIRKRAGWLEGNGKTAAVAELVETGVVRLRSSESLHDTLEEMYADICSPQNNEGSGFLLEAATFKDRFRHVSIYTDGRLYLSEAVLQFLEVETDRDRLFVQAVGTLVEILSPRVRERRLDEYRHHVLPLR